MQKECKSVFLPVRTAGPSPRTPSVPAAQIAEEVHVPGPPEGPRKFPQRRQTTALRTGRPDERNTERPDVPETIPHPQEPADIIGISLLRSEHRRRPHGCRADRNDGNASGKKSSAVQTTKTCIPESSDVIPDKGPRCSEVPDCISLIRLRENAPPDPCSELSSLFSPPLFVPARARLGPEITKATTDRDFLIPSRHKKRTVLIKDKNEQ